MDNDGLDNLSLVSHPSAHDYGGIAVPFSARNSADIEKSSTNDEEGHAKSHRGYGEIKGFTYSKNLTNTKLSNLAKLDQILGARESVMTSMSRYIKIFSVICSEPSERAKSHRQISAPDHEDMSLGDGDMDMKIGAQQHYGNSNLNLGFKFKNTFSSNDFK